MENDAPRPVVDVLKGAGAIAEFLFGDRRSRRSVYYLVETRRMPVFRLGSVICARRSTLLEWISNGEQKAVGGFQ